MALQNSLSGVDKIICQTRHEADFFLTQWGVSSQCLEIIGVGIETTHEYAASPIPLNTHDDDKALVLFLGTNDLYKGAEAVIHLSFRFSGEKVRFALAGGQTNSFRDFLELMLLLPTENLTILGRIDESCKHHLLQNMTCLLMPSIAESFGQVYLESWLHKKPVIAADYGATACLIDHDTDGLLVDFNDIDGMEAAVRRYLNSPELCTQHGNAGYHKAKRYDWSLLYPQVRQIYSDLVQKAPCPSDR
jgi:glycosyltransferase involved in cell wall biosynthesis